MIKHQRNTNTIPILIVKTGVSYTYYKPQYFKIFWAIKREENTMSEYLKRK